MQSCGQKMHAVEGTQRMMFQIIGKNMYESSLIFIVRMMQAPLTCGEKLGRLEQILLALTLSCAAPNCIHF